MLDELFSAVGLATNNLRDSTSMLLGNSIKEQSIQDIIAESQNQVAKDKSAIVQQEGVAALKAQNTRLKIANKFGTDVNAQTNVIDALVNTSAQAYADRDAALSEITKKQSVTIFDNPLEYIMNRFTINADIAKHNAADARISNAEQRITQLNADTDSTIKVNKQLDESLTQATLEAATRLAASQANDAALKAKLDGIRNNSQGIKDVMAASKESLTNSFSLYSAAQSQEHLKQSMSSLELQRARFENEKEEFATKRTGIEDAKQFDSSLLDNVNKGLVITGGKPLDNVTGKQALALMKGNSPLAKQYYDLYQIGQQSAQEGRPVIATSIGNAAQILSELPVKITPAQMPVKNLINAARDEFVSRRNTVGTPESQIDKNDRAAINKAISDIGNSMFAQKAANIDPADGTNPFHIGSINQLGEVSEIVRALPIYQKVFASKVSAGVQISDPKVIFQMTVDAFRRKDITYNEALELATIYHVGVGLSTAAKQFSAFGIVPPLSYKAQVPIGTSGNFAGGAVIDFTKPDILGRAFNKAFVESYLAESVNLKIQSGTYIPGITQ